MGFISVLIALIIEQIKPLPMRNPVYTATQGVVLSLERYFNAGERQHGVLAWWALMLLALLTSGGVYWLALEINWALALLVNVIFLYLTLGFRQFSHAYTEIQLALENGDLPLARKILGEWMRDVDPGFIADRLTPGEVARHAIERALMLSHRHVFGVFFWFVLLPGPTGAVMYRVAQVAARAWRRQSPDSPFADFAQRAYTLVDWLPTRFTAVGFAIVGNFEDAMYGWRHEAGRWQDPSEGVVLAAGAGAMGIRLGGGIDNPLPTQQVVMAESGLEMEASVEPGSGMEVEPGHLRSAVGLVWRAMVLWLILLLMLSVTSWVT
ncbi:MAG: CobD/CbiB family protein [Burkholderiales bacterium]|jgi:adenosylcobinamide-phosphate synthase|nr:CobD/CbiB family protein [Burkholderiales bacterium]MCA3155629.1 CobD/CbiB family protein [Burkholderiales bacterium]MCA3157933.1 CobD/CbiB family protein [Burkholderiales bacterium]MCA3166970.1 CobD/CbiB family protein [Burkholderiales bacterium]MCA3175759.1 CobD/CbiB family protein [Burkholderiales bacterium]